MNEPTCCEFNARGLTPHALTVLLHHYYIPAGYPFERDSSAYKFAVEHFVGIGVFDRADYPSVTEKGTAWIRAILNTPIPRQVWLLADGSVYDAGEAK